MRYLYIKNGDVVDQILRIISNKNNIDSTGPDAFISDLLITYIQKNPILLISASGRRKCMEIDNIKAYVLPDRSNKGRVTETAILRIKIFIVTLVLIFKFSPDRLICGRSGSMLWASFLYSVLFSKPLVVSRHEVLQRNQKNILKKLAVSLDKFCMMRSKAVICHGPYLKDQLSAMMLDPKKIIEFDIIFDNQMRKTVEVSDSHVAKMKRKILYIGRIEKSKGVYDLYHAFKLLSANQENAILVFVGIGSDLYALKRKAKDDKINDYIFFKGYVSHKKIFEIIADSFIVVTPTRSIQDVGEAAEARCMTAMESIFMGVPVIAPDSGPFPYLIKDRFNGLLFRTNSYKSLAKAISLVLNQNDLYNEIRAGAERSADDSVKSSILSFSGAVHKAFNVGR